MTYRLNKDMSVPIVITNKIVSKKPTINRRTKFLGIRKGIYNLVKNISISILDNIHDSFFESEIDVEDTGNIREDHYAIQIEELELGPELTITKMPYKPACGHHYEMIKIKDSIEEQPDDKDPDLDYIERARPSSGFRGFTADRPTPKNILKG